MGGREREGAGEELMRGEENRRIESEGGELRERKQGSKRLERGGREEGVSEGLGVQTA